MTCPNCGSEDYHHNYGGGKRCNFCNYHSDFPNRKPAIPVAARRIDPNSPEWKAEVEAYITTHGYTCCGSKVVGQHERDCRERGKKRGETWGT